MGYIFIRVQDPLGNDKGTIEVPDDVPVNRILVILIEKLKMPKYAPDGGLLSYKFHHQASKRQLLDNETLKDAGVKEGDILRLQPEITAGGEDKDREEDSVLLRANKKIVEEHTCNICGGSFSIGENIKKCNKCGNFYHLNCWKENGGCNQPECQENTKSCPFCGKLIKKNAVKCRFCGEYLEESIQVKLKPFGKNEELKNYVLNARGIGRVMLNIVAGIGVFIFGWLIAIVFSDLGKGGRGLCYLIPIIIFLYIGRSSEPTLAALAPLLYIIAWIDANRILSKYKSMAKERISEIDQYGANNGNLLLEKGILLYKVLENKKFALNTLSNATKFNWNDPYLLNIAGKIMYENKRYKESQEFLEKALENATDENLIRKIKKILNKVK